MERASVPGGTGVRVTHAQQGTIIRAGNGLMNGCPLPPRCQATPEERKKIGINKGEPDLDEVAEQVQRGEGDASMVLCKVEIATEVGGRQVHVGNTRLQGMACPFRYLCVPCVGKQLS